MRAAWTSWWSSADEARAWRSRSAIRFACSSSCSRRRSFSRCSRSISRAWRSAAARAVSSRGDRFVRSGFITQSVRNYSERYKYEISANIPQGLNCYPERSARRHA